MSVKKRFIEISFPVKEVSEIASKRKTSATVTYQRFTYGGQDGHLQAPGRLPTQHL